MMALPHALNIGPRLKSNGAHFRSPSASNRQILYGALHIPKPASHPCQVDGPADDRTVRCDFCRVEHGIDESPDIEA